jgi:hypothetical protein
VTADAIPVTDTHLVVRKTIDSQIFSEHSVFAERSAQHLLPVSVGSDLVDHDGSMHATMAVAISLAIAVEVDAPCHHATVHRALPDSSADDLAVPLHICWKANIDRNDLAHGSGLCEHQKQLISTCYAFQIVSSAWLAKQIDL